MRHIVSLHSRLFIEKHTPFFLVLARIFCEQICAVCARFYASETNKQTANSYELRIKNDSYIHVRMGWPKNLSCVHCTFQFSNFHFIEKFTVPKYFETAQCIVCNNSMTKYYIILIQSIFGCSFFFVSKIAQFDGHV